jgi:predicted nuclease of predicted toxin-antitoxin system
VQKLLVDENLSPSLVGLATDKGFVCSHVNHLGLTGQKDWELKATILEGDCAWPEKVERVAFNRSSR